MTERQDTQSQSEAETTEHKITVEDGVARITLNRPEAGNALSPTQPARLAMAFEELGASLEVRAILLTGTGPHFCTGADLRAWREVDRPPRPSDAPDRIAGEATHLMRVGWQRLIGAVLDCEKPVIAAVHGAAAGGGAQLAVACDLVVASEGARFIEVFVRRGLAPDAGAAYLLPRLMGLQRAKEMVFFGDDLSAIDAHQLGLVNRVVAESELSEVATAWAERLASGPTKAIGFAKFLLNRSLESDRETAFREEALVQEIVTSTVDSQVAVSAFVDRRDGGPEFVGW